MTATYSYRVGLLSAANTDVVINEIMAAKTHTLADRQVDYDDRIELHDVTDSEVGLTGRDLTDDPTNPRKWSFPEGTEVPARGFLLVWADEDGKAATTPVTESRSMGFVADRRELWPCVNGSEGLLCCKPFRFGHVGSRICCELPSLHITV
jgi:hypothetical protein